MQFLDKAEHFSWRQEALEHTYIKNMHTELFIVALMFLKVVNRVQSRLTIHESEKMC